MPEQNLELGPCLITVGGADVGRTVGPARVAIRTIWRDRLSDRHGAAVVDRIAMSAEVRAVFRLSEKTLDNLRRALPSAEAGEGFLSLGRAPGFRAASAAVTLRLHPEERADDGRDVVLHKAVAAGVLELAYGPGAQRTFEVEFTALLDPARSDGDRLARLHQAE